MNTCTFVIYILNEVGTLSSGLISSLTRLVNSANECIREFGILWGEKPHLYNVRVFLRIVEGSI